jgi:uncharacterized protein YndB with AHSA1/START domain
MSEIMLQRDFAFTREEVWTALTDKVQLSDWLMKTDFEPIVGHRFTFQTDPAPGFDGTVHCEVTRLEPMNVLEFTWRGGPLDTRVSFTLSDTTSGTRVVLKHSGFKGMKTMIPRIVMRFGWPNIFKKLETCLLRNRGQIS